VKRSGPAFTLAHVSVQAASPTGEIVLSPPPPPLVRTFAPAAQTVAVAAGGILAGAAIVGLAGRRRARAGKALGRRASRGRAARRAGSRRGGARRQGLEILTTRSLLVDIHLLGVPGAER
jgi:hypothetical protein